MTTDRHTCAHVKGADGRSPEIEGYIGRGIDWAVAMWDSELARAGLLSRSPSSALDMGSDYGFALHYLNTRYNMPKTALVGIDPYYTHNPFDLDLRRLAMDDPMLPTLLNNSTFEFLVLNHTLEHVPNPYAVMQNCHRLLHPTQAGYVFVAVPHAGDPWAHWDGHYTIWDERWLPVFMARNGFRTRFIEVQELRPGHREIWGLFSR